jgi:hypothetical protein
VIALLLAALAGCTGGATARFEQCTLDVSLSAEAAPPGALVRAIGGRQTDRADTWVRVGDVPAEVVSIERSECAVCDACREATCSACETCPACVTACEPCEEAATLRVPDVAAGRRAVVIANAWGQSPPLWLTVTDPDTDTDTSADTDTDTSADTDTDTDTDS